MRDELARLHDRGVGGPAVASRSTSPPRPRPASTAPTSSGRDPRCRASTHATPAACYEELVGGAQTSLWISAYTYYDGPQGVRTAGRSDGRRPALQITLLLNIQRDWRRQPRPRRARRRFADRCGAADWPGQRRPDVFYDPRSLLRRRRQGRPARQGGRRRRRRRRSSPRRTSPRSAFDEQHRGRRALARPRTRHEPVEALPGADRARTIGAATQRIGGARPPRSRRGPTSPHVFMHVAGGAAELARKHQRLSASTAPRGSRTATTH